MGKEEIKKAVISQLSQLLQYPDNLDEAAQKIYQNFEE